MKINATKQIKVDSFTLFASLPDMGRVGGLVSSFLAQNLKCELLAEIVSADKPWVSYADGVVKSASDAYRIHYDSERRLMVFTGESQPQDPGERTRSATRCLTLRRMQEKFQGCTGQAGICASS